MSASIPISNLTYLLVAAGIDPLNYMDEIPNECFYMCNDLVSIEIPGSVKSIEDGTFYEIPLDFMNPTTKFSIAYNEKVLDKTTLRFLEYLRDYFEREFH